MAGPLNAEGSLTFWVRLTKCLEDFKATESIRIQSTYRSNR